MIDRDTVEFILSQWGAAYSMLPAGRNADRARVVDVACAALKVRANVPEVADQSNLNAPFMRWVNSHAHPSDINARNAWEAGVSYGQQHQTPPATG